MLRRTAGLALVLLIVLPGASLAVEPDARPATGCPDGAEVCIQLVPPVREPGTPPGFSYYIAAVEQRGATVKIEGKLWIEGDQLGASVGCNQIGARVSFDGRTLVIRQALVTTKMACDETTATAERTLVRALAAGPFTWDGSGFGGTAVRIVASQAGVPPPQPPDGDGAAEPVGKPGVDPGTGNEPEPGLDLEACRAFIPEKEWEAVFGPAFGRPGSGSTSSGSGGGTVGSGGREGEPPPAIVDPTPTTPPLAEPNPETPTEPDTTPGTVDPEPIPLPSADHEASAEPTAAPPIEPTIEPTAAPPIEPTTEPISGSTSGQLANDADQPVAMDLPAPVAAHDGDATRLPAKVQDHPTMKPGAETCRELLLRIRTMVAAGAPPGAPSTDGKAEAASAADMRAERSSAALTDPVVVLLLVLAAGSLLVLWLRSIPPRRPAA
jgi:hypothetical protein